MQISGGRVHGRLRDGLRVLPKDASIPESRNRRVRQGRVSQMNLVSLKPFVPRFSFAVEPFRFIPRSPKHSPATQANLAWP